MLEHVVNTIRQLRRGEFIGRRQTPVVSYCDMRPKWEKYSSAWEYTGSDGSAFVEDGRMIVPAILKLIYVKSHDGRVCQMAYVLYAEVVGPLGSPLVESALARLEALTRSLPRNLC